MDVRNPAMAMQAVVAAPEVAIVLPTFNERDNIPVVYDRIEHALAGVDWEIIFVDDDSPDGTAAAANEIGGHDRRVRCIRRIGRRGLAGACIEGMLATQARYVAVMDADLQHDETQLSAMLAKLRTDAADLVVASRYCDGASPIGLSARRAAASRWSVALIRRLLKVGLTDPMSGFFMIRRELVAQMAPSLSTQGFKILLDIAVTGHGRLRTVELPCDFGPRLHGVSKLDSRVVLDFGQLLLSKFTRDAISFRFVLFCLVGLSGVGIHMTALTALHVFSASSFDTAQIAATITAIAWNFVFNNSVTYRDQRLTGWRFVYGLLEFELICAVGVLSNVGIADLIYGSEGTWWLAGLGGAIMGAVWNYAMSAAFVWRAR